MANFPTVSDDETRAIRQRLQRMARARQKALEGETEAIVTALRLGVRRSDVARDIARSRTHIDRIADTHGIPGRYPPRGKKGAEPPTSE